MFVKHKTCCVLEVAQTTTATLPKYENFLRYNDLIICFYIHNIAQVNEYVQKGMYEHICEPKIP